MSLRLLKPRILSIDDEPSIGEMVRVVFEESGEFVVETETNPLAALERATRFQPDLLLLDVGMPGLDGYAVARQFRLEQGLRHKPIVFFSGLDGVQDLALQAGRGGPTGLIKKGLPIAQLEEIVRSHTAERLECFRAAKAKAERGPGWLEKELKPASEPPALRGGSMPAARRPQILIVDDESFMRHLIAASLKGKPYAVHTCSSGEAALAHVAQHSPDLVIVDLMMPGADGLATLEALRTFTGDIPAIMLTATGDSLARRRAEDMGVEAFITKPFSPRLLLAHVERLLPSRASAGTDGPGESVRLSPILQTSAGSFSRL
jgi:CheY-like chemotaxis protein